MTAFRPSASPGTLSPATFRGPASVAIDLDVLIYVPAVEPPGDGFPAILSLHGKGEREHLEDVASYGPPMLARTEPSFPWVVLAPRCPPERGWETLELAALLDRALEDLPIDPDRVVVAGHSMGGYGAWSMVLAYPEYFAAAVPICGGAPVATPGYISPERMRAIADVPIRAFHGADDEVVPVWESSSIVEELMTHGCDVSLTVYEGVGHDSWSRTYADPELWRWLAAQRRSSSEAGASRA